MHVSFFELNRDIVTVCEESHEEKTGDQPTLKKKIENSPYVIPIICRLFL